MKENQTPMSDALERYAGWIKALADLQGGREFFSDQQPSSLWLLGRLAEIYKPTVVIEMGTNYGLSLRRWVELAPGNFNIHCIDGSFKPLRDSESVLPIAKDCTLEEAVKQGAITLHEGWAHDVNLQSLWKPEDVVLLFVDIHSDHEHVLKAIPDLPPGSIVVVDDFWRSDCRLETVTHKAKFFTDTVLPQVDRSAPREIMPQSYSDYWRGGGFWGFDEVPIICKWCAERRVTLHWEPGIKEVWFQWPQDSNTPA